MDFKYLIILFLFLCNLTYAQKYVFIDKDARIVKHEKGIVKFLNRHQNQLDSNFIDEITIKKRLEIYDRNGNDILLIKFESLADHVDEYYGLIINNDAFLFHSIDDKEFIRFCEMIKDPKIIDLIKHYLIEYPADEYHGHQFIIEKNTDTDTVRRKHRP